RALGLTRPEDKIQIHPALLSEWDAILEHYEQAGISHSHDVIWDISLAEIDRHPNYEASFYFFGDAVNPHGIYRQVFQQLDSRWCQVVDFINSKNNFIDLAEELGIPVPKTLRFDTLAAAKACESIPFPCYVKPAVSDHGFGIMRCADEVALEVAFSQLADDEPLQIQAEVQASAFLNLQYEVTSDGVQPLLVSEQILDGCVHGGNRYPSRYAPWQEVAPFAQWMSDRGMGGIFAVDVAVVPEAEKVHYLAIECNPRFNGSSYPTLVAHRLDIPCWSSVTYKTPKRSLKEFDIADLTFDPATGKGVILINWGTIKTGKLNVLLAGTELEQAELGDELQSRLQHEMAFQVALERRSS
ncbi:MAG: ATP-grasp domain-containing protein, partial [Leptolyngbya sp. SIO1D8]|nr:ATP-grasp domain-containing protein [Leptolyngbya sp. SIO1D8]